MKHFNHLTAEEHEIFKYLLEEEGVEVADDRIIQPRKEAHEAPLSFAQQRLWFLDQLEPGSPFYNLPRALRLEGSLDLTTLQDSLSEIVRRHEILRTSFGMIHGEPVQVISLPKTVDLPVVDLTGASKEWREKEVVRLATEDARLPFDLRVGPLLRVVIVKMAGQEHVTLFTMHHIISDAWSAGVLIGEVAALYEAFLAGKPSPLADLPIQYADFACWQRKWLQGEVLQEQFSYWKSQLAGNPPVLELPADRSRPAVQTFKGATQPLQLSNSLTASLGNLNREEGATFFMLLLAAFKVLLNRYTSECDIVIGFPSANRARPELEQMIGFFANTLVLRTDLSGDPTFRRLLNRVRDVVLEAHNHQDLPFEKLVDELQPERDLSRNPLFDVMFVHNNAPATAKGLPGITMSLIEVNGGAAKFDLILFTQKTIDGVAGSIIYNTDLFDASTITRLAGHYRNLLEGIAADPDTLISDLPLLTEGEQRQLMEWNDTARDYQIAECVHHVFEQQVRRAPHTVAVEWQDRQLTYERLNSRANQLASFLRRHDIGPESLVGVHLNRTAELIVAILGILKAGAAYVPIDPEYPAERVAFMLEDSSAAVVLTERHLVDQLYTHDAIVVSIDSQWDGISRESESNLDTQAVGQNLAYAIFTSGSTGRPKSVGIQHRNAMAFIEWAREVFRVEDLKRVLASTSICFDLSIFEMLVPLSVGGTVVVAGNALDISSAGAGGQVSLINTVPSAMRELVRERRIPDSVKIVNLAGEPLPRKLVEDIYRSSKVDQVWNLYGPTEYTTYATHVMVNRGADQPVTIGRPLAQTEIYLLDAHLHLIPIGVTGDLYISGEGLARGYLKRPNLTAERFVPNPFGAEPGARMYRTGDQARYLPSGEIDFLGRRDNQVKIRGFRIELGEIEATLSRHPNVMDVAVTVGEDRLGEKYLAAYLVFEQGTELNVNDTRRYLAEKLPEYVIPSHFIQLDSLPLTPNGKIDRQALPAPDMIRPDLSEAFKEARTPVEEVVAQVWADILELDKVGVNDNFFNLGGHSLLATKVNSRLRDSFNVDLPLRRLFEAPTVAGLAGLIEAEMRDGRSFTISPILPAPRDALRPLSFAQERLWFLSNLDPGNAAYNIHHAIQLKGDLNTVLLEKSFTEVLRRHDALRTTMTAVDGRWFQVINPPQPFNLPVIDLNELMESGRRQLAMSIADGEAQRPFDTAPNSLLRASVLRLDDDDHIVLLTIHHTIVDAWSIGLLLRELSALYRAFSKGLSSPLPELTIQYADYACWQRQWLQGEVLERQFSYWKRQLEGNLPVLNLPTDRPRPATQTFRGTTESRLIRNNTLSSLKRLSAEQGVTFFMLLLAAWKVLLHRYSNQDDVIVGTPIAGRNRIEIEDLIGLFLNMLALRTDLSGDPSFAVLLARVREVSLGAYMHQDMPFERLVEELQPERDLSRSPLFQVIFILQNASPQNIALPGLAWNSIAVESKTAKFDLSLQISEINQGLVASLQYKSDLFDATTIERMLCHFERLLEAIAAAPSRQISMLPMLTGSEVSQLLLEFNDTGTPYPVDTCIHRLFETQTESTPDKVAIIFDEERVSYLELNARANRLAHYLKSLGVGPGVRVGISLERSSQMVVAVFAVLKTGGAYLPLDPTYPRQRLSFMLDDCQAQFLLTESRSLPEFPDYKARIVTLDVEQEVIATHSGENSYGNVTGADLAYVIYTSGSSGNPKGIRIRHRAVVNFLLSLKQLLEPDAEDVLLAVTTLSFDIAGLEIFLPLVAGARAVVASREMASDGTKLMEAMDHYGVTMMQATPTTWQLLNGAGWQGDKRLKVFCGGESMPQNLADRLLQTCGAVWNLYGPTETTIWSTAYNLTPPDSRVLIGRPIANTQVYILDRNLQPAPIGVVGDLTIGGDGLAVDYHNRPELTAQSFIPHPFGGEPGARLYRTGDLARFLKDGAIDYLGRADFQVKIRGYRIELGEIEAILNQHPSIETAIVQAKDIKGDKRLVAYVRPRQSERPTLAGLRSYLDGNLPAYMQPAALIALDQLPLTPNGKVDRKSLLALDIDGLGGGAGFVSPRNPIEDLLVNIWAEVLGVKTVGVHDNFFELGGHSLLATQVLSRISQSLQVDIPLRVLFETPTIEHLAIVISQATLERKGGPLPAISPAPRGGHLPLSFVQQRIWFIHKLAPDSAAYNLAGAYRLEGELDEAALISSLYQMAARHEALRTKFVTVDGEPAQLISTTPSLPLQIIDIQELSDSEREIELSRLVKQQRERAFNLAEDAPWRVSLLRSAAERHMLAVSMHHIISDGWSMNIFYSELVSLYEALRQGKASPLEDLQVQYADYAVWQRAWMQGEILEKELSYWEERLAGAAGVIDLPVDRIRPPLQSFHGKSEPITLGEELTSELKALSRRESVTLFMTLVAGLDVLLFRYSNQEDIIVSTGVAGRNSKETERMIGCLVNIVLLRVDLAGDPSFNELLRQVKDVSLGAYAHQDVPFEMIVQRTNLERDSSRQQMYQVMIIMMNMPEAGGAEGASLEIAAVETEEEMAQCDLMIHLRENGSGISGKMAYNTDIFESKTIRRMIEHFKNILQSAVRNSNEKVSAINVLGEDEAYQVITEWNNTHEYLGAAKCLHQLFEETAEKRAAAIALVSGNRQFSYGELNGRANQLAAYLRNEGVGPEERVGLCLERGVEMVVAILGILKAGGAYVPIDPDYPRDRISFMIDDAQISVLVTNKGIAERIGSGLVIRSMLLDEESAQISRGSKQNIECGVMEENLSYLIYTSGSTGRPKAVTIAHKGPVNNIRDLNDKYRIGDKDAWLAVSSVSFDLCVYDVLGTLAAGGRIIMAAGEARLDPRKWIEMIEQEQVTVWNSAPALLESLVAHVEERGGDSLRSLKVAILGADWVPVTLPDRLKSLAPDVQVVVLGGSTEVSIYSMEFPVIESQAGRRSIPYGRPMKNQQCFVIDRRMEITARGVAGELYLGGTGLGRGYYGAAERTAEKFVADWLSGSKGARLYRTGDLARYLDDGTIELLGRMDFQVKIRGHRIELGEIEAALKQRQEVAEAVVIAMPDNSGSKRLIAYIVGENGADISERELGLFLKSRLPQYMVPAVFVSLESMPLSPNGKIDRRRLPAPHDAECQVAQNYVAPRTPLEATLVEIWQEILGVERIGIRDNFFDLGGHSLLVVQIVSRLHDSLSIDFPLRAVFENLTVEELADAVEQLLMQEVAELSEDEALQLLGQEA